MDTVALYEIIDKEKISIINFKWTNAKARIFELNNQYHIGIDNRKINNGIEEKEVLAEELGHYFCNALYYINSSQEVKNKCETRAKNWAYSVLIPFNTLQEKIAQGFDLYSLADYFDVDVKYMIDCINFYTSKYGILV